MNRNQIRVGEALTPDSSTRTSIYDRILSRQQRELEIDRQEVETNPAGKSTDNNSPDGWLCELTLEEQDVVCRFKMVNQLFGPRDPRRSRRDWVRN